MGALTGHMLDQSLLKREICLTFMTENGSSGVS